MYIKRLKRVRLMTRDETFLVFRPQCTVYALKRLISTASTLIDSSIASLTTRPHPLVQANVMYTLIDLQYSPCPHLPTTCDRTVLKFPPPTASHIHWIIYLTSNSHLTSCSCRLYCPFFTTLKYCFFALLLSHFQS